MRAANQAGEPRTFTSIRSASPCGDPVGDDFLRLVGEGALRPGAERGGEVSRRIAPLAGRVLRGLGAGRVCCAGRGRRPRRRSPIRCGAPRPASRVRRHPRPIPSGDRGRARITGRSRQSTRASGGMVSPVVRWIVRIGDLVDVDVGLHLDPRFSSSVVDSASAGGPPSWSAAPPRRAPTASVLGRARVLRMTSEAKS